MHFRAVGHNIPLRDPCRGTVGILDAQTGFTANYAEPRR